MTAVAQYAGKVLLWVRFMFYLKVICCAIIVLSLMHHGWRAHTHTYIHTCTSVWVNLILSGQMSDSGRIIAGICPSLPDPSWCERISWRRREGESEGVDAKFFNRLHLCQRRCFIFFIFAFSCQSDRYVRVAFPINATSLSRIINTLDARAHIHIYKHTWQADTL